MAQDLPVTQTMKISDVRSQLNTLVNEVYREETRVIVEKSGIPVAGLVSIDDLRWLADRDRVREKRFSVIDEVRKSFAGIANSEIEIEGARDLAEVRKEIREELESGAAASR